ncbi:MAG: acylphosphatase [Sporolactobacillus sp.]
MTADQHNKQVHLRITGFVQAVGFRHFTWQAARSLDVTGWVRNRDDGSVEVVASASSDIIDQFIDVIRKGNRFSHVDSVTVTSPQRFEHFASFDILDSL